MNIFCTKLSSETTNENLQELFSRFGSVESAKIVIDRETGKSKCYGFVEMSDDSQAESAIQQLNESDYMGRTIVVKKAQPKEGGDSRRNSRGGFNRKY